MEWRGTIELDIDGRTISIPYLAFYFRDSYYVDVTDKHGDRHRFRRDDDEWRYTSLKPLKWRYDFVVKLFKAMDEEINGIKSAISTYRA